MWIENKNVHKDLIYINSCSFILWDRLKNKTIFITGTTGLIGQNIVNGLLYADLKRKLNLRIIGLVRDLDKAKQIFRTQLKETNSLSFVVGDVRTFEYPSQDIDYIIHGASITASKDFVEKSEEVKSIAINGTKHLLELARLKKVSSFVYLSSMEVYGYPKKGHICLENEAWDFNSNNPRDSYPIAKLECEMLCSEYYHKYGIPTKSIRLSQTFGPCDRLDSRLFSYFENCFLEKKDIVFNTKANSERCYLYSADCVTGIITVLLSGDDDSIYNLGNRSMYGSINDIAHILVEKIFDNEIGIKYKITNPKVYPKESYIKMDTHKIEKLGWKCNYGYESLKYMKHDEILIVTTSLGNDGAERVLSELIDEWSNNGYSITIIETLREKKELSYILPSNIKRINIFSSSKIKIFEYYSNLKRIIRILQDHRNAVVISFLPKTQFLLACASIFVDNRLIFSERNNPDMWPNSIAKRYLRDLSFLFADVCVFQTSYAMSRFPKRVIKKGIIIKNPINSNLPVSDFECREKKIITVCRLEKQKNIEMLIRAYKIFNDSHKDYVLDIYGQGKEKDNLLKLVNDLKLSKYICFKGFEKDIYEKMKRAKLFILTSNFEGISNSMLEAMSIGIPTICTDCPVYGAREIIVNKKNGFLVDRNDYIGLSRIMNELIENEELYKEISKESKLIRNRFPLSQIAIEWTKIFN